MGDPISLASGIAAVVSLGLTVCHGTQNYFDAIQNRTGDITSAALRLDVLRKNAELLHSQTRALQARYASAAKVVLYCLRACETELQSLEKLLQKLYPFQKSADAQAPENKWRNRRLAAKYPFNRNDLRQMEVQLSRAAATLGIVVNALIL